MDIVSETFATITKRTRAKKRGSALMGHCPAHDDVTPSLSISRGEGGRVLLKCFAGCATEDVCAALDLKLSDLMPPRSEAVKANGHGKGDSLGPIVSEYTYGPRHRVTRHDPKTFRPWHRGANGAWVMGSGPDSWPLFQQDAIEAAGPDALVFVVEGERDVDALAALGLVATTNAGGAGKWLAAHSEALRGRRVAILPDNDKPGEAHAEKVAKALHGIAKETRIVRLPDLPERGDVSDWLNAGGTAAGLLALVENAAPVTVPAGPDFVRISSANFVRIQVPAYPLHVWPQPLADYFAAAADVIGAPVDMIATSATAIIGAAIGNRRPLLVRSGMVVRPILWTLVIAETGTGKSPSYDRALDLVAGLQSDAAEHFTYKLEAWERAERERPKKHTEPRPVLQHFYTTNATMEWFAPAARDSAGICFARDELLGWFLDFNAYRAKGGDRQTWLSLWSGGALKIDRRGADTIFAEHPVATVTGAIQPGKLPELARDATDDGFLARFLITMPDAGVPDWSDGTLEAHTANAAKDVMRQLRHHDYRAPVPLDPHALAAYKAFYQDNVTALDGVPDMLRAAYAKLPVQAARLALTLHCCHDPEATLDAVPAARMVDAIELTEYHAAHAIRAYHGLGIVAPDRLVGLPRRILSAVRRAEGPTASRRELHVLLGGHTPADDLSRALDDLCERGLLVMERIGGTGGRPAERYRLPNLEYERSKTSQYEQSPLGSRDTERDSA